MCKPAAAAPVFWMCWSPATASTPAWLRQLKEETGGSDFVFVTGRQVVTSTLPRNVVEPLAARLIDKQTSPNDDYLALRDAAARYSRQQPLGQLFILRSFEAARQSIATLRREIVVLWISAMIAALLVTYFVARRIMRPVAELDRAAAEIARQNYGYRVDVRSGDELGRLAGTFNGMCESIQQAREELTRQERISTIGRLSTSIVHDLRNPLAAIYAGAEMLFDGNLPMPQVRRLANNIYRASRGIQDMLQQLLHVSRGSSGHGRSLRGSRSDCRSLVGRRDRSRRPGCQAGHGRPGEAWSVSWSAPAWSACSATCSKTRWK